jgi:hypothetical protein
MPILKRPHDIPAVPVASGVVDENGKLTQEFVHFLRALADLVRDIDDVEVLARESDWRPTAQSEILADPASDKQILYNTGGTVTSDPNFTWDSSNQVATVTGKTGGTAYPALLVTDPNTPHTAYLQSDGGFLTTNVSTSSVNVPNGGVLAKDMAATDSAWNGLQNSSGGVAANALYTKTNTSAPANPGSGYGGFDYQGGTKYWYWNDTTPGWATVDLSAAGGSQTPWTSNIDAANHNLSNLAAITGSAGNISITSINIALGGAVSVSGSLSATGAVALSGLPSTAPAAGSKQLWYDPTDGNRVKFVP